MFRSTITINHPTLTFSTVEEFITELKKYYDDNRYQDALMTYSNRMAVGAKTLINGSTLEEVFLWDDENTYLQFYLTGDDLLDAISKQGFIRTIKLETI